MFPNNSLQPVQSVLAGLVETCEEICSFQGLTLFEYLYRTISNQM